MTPARFLRPIRYARFVRFLMLFTPLVTISCGDRRSPPAAEAPPADDPYVWLEEVNGEEALAWVAERNEESLARLQGDPRYKPLREQALAIFEASDRIPYGSYFGGYVHNFWQDEDNVRGVWRRTTLDSYASDTPAWETVLDVDALAAEELENWVYKGRSCLPPEYRRCLVRLSRGGGDAVVVREFDPVEKSFVPDGFIVPEAKSNVSWIDEDAVFVGTDFGDGSMTSSGYPRTVRVWQRGTPLSNARQIAETDSSHVSISGFVNRQPDGASRFVQVTPAFFRTELYWLDDDFQRLRVPLQEDASFRGQVGEHLLVLLRSDWTVEGVTYPEGSLLSVHLPESVRAGTASGVELVLAPSDRMSIRGVSESAGAAYVSILDEVTGSLLRLHRADDHWLLTPVVLPANGSLSVTSADPFSDVVMVNYESFTVPDRLYLLRDGREPRVIKSLPDRFDASAFVTEQKFATSADGERIPYFVVRPADLPFDGTAPTLLYGYGGFEVSLTPSYASPGTIAWLQNGGVYVLANIRGGGEFGPSWHEAALLENRQRAYDDFIAVAEDLIDSGITRPEHLGISGGSNGGLLVGAVTMQRPDLFGAVVCSVPLLDMLRYHKLLAGASWMAEYGNPDDPAARAFIENYSPYQNVRPDVEYPEIFFWTNTRDDRVHPGHPRKMVARMQEQGHPVLYYENTEGGHSAGANLRQAATTSALTTVYLLQQLSD
jgi:prolyl oligopeptidase